jgi:integral membrane protein
MDTQLNTNAGYYTLLRWFLTIAIIEAISYLLLLGFGMPMKYWGNDPSWVKLFGRIHGGLVFAFIALLIACWVKYKWTYERAILLFLASLLPIVPFILDRKLRKEYGLSK